MAAISGSLKADTPMVCPGSDMRTPSAPTKAMTQP
jgi:hypothetical protein